MTRPLPFNIKTIYSISFFLLLSCHVIKPRPSIRNYQYHVQRMDSFMHNNISTLDSSVFMDSFPQARILAYVKDSISIFFKNEYKTYTTDYFMLIKDFGSDSSTKVYYYYRYSGQVFKIEKYTHGQLSSRRIAIRNRLHITYHKNEVYY